MNLKIESNVPLPEFRGEIVAAVARMNVGDSIPGLKRTQVVYIQHLLKASGKMGTSRKEGAGHRIWRTK